MRRSMRIADPASGIFPIGVVADMIGTSQKQLRVYEARGIIRPSRSDGNRRLYSQYDVELLTFIHYLVSVERVNLAGVKFILGLLEKMPPEEKRNLVLSIEDSIRQLSIPQKAAFMVPVADGGDDSLLLPAGDGAAAVKKTVTNDPGKGRTTD